MIVALFHQSRAQVVHLALESLDRCLRPILQIPYFSERPVDRHSLVLQPQRLMVTRCWSCLGFASGYQLLHHQTARNTAFYSSRCQICFQALLELPFEPSHWPTCVVVV